MRTYKSFILLASALIVCCCSKESRNPEKSDGSAISSASEFANFMENKDGKADYSKSASYYLACDIDMNEVFLSACPDSFAGTFDGKGFKILNWQAGTPLFKKLLSTGCIKNLTFDETCGFMMDKDEFPYIGCFAGELEGAAEKCINNASLIGTGDGAAIGGFTGRIGNTGSMTDCEQYGSVDCLTDASDISVGGLIGTTPDTGGTFPLKGCYVVCNVSAPYQTWYHSGMVVGHFPNMNQDCTLGTKDQPVLVGGHIKSKTFDTDVTYKNHQSFLSGYGNMSACCNFIYGAFNGLDIDITGKTIIMCGNSQTYWGGAVAYSQNTIDGGLGGWDTGMIYQVFKACGQPVKVIDLCHGGASIGSYYEPREDSHDVVKDNTEFTKQALKTCNNDYDYVFYQEGGSNTNDLADIKKMQTLYFNKEGIEQFFISHNFTYARNHSKIILNIINREYEKLGLQVCEWGRIAADLDCGRSNATTGKNWVYNTYEGHKDLNVHGGTVTYHYYQFTKCNQYTLSDQGTDETDAAGILKGYYQDHHHPNPLAGYLQSIMMYSAITGKSCVGLPYREEDGIPWSTIHCASSHKGIDTFIKYQYLNNYNVTQDMKKIIASESDMDGLQRMCNWYMAPYRMAE